VYWGVLEMASDCKNRCMELHEDQGAAKTPLFTIWMEAERERMR
jgi:hypothetical protein